MTIEEILSRTDASDHRNAIAEIKRLREWIVMADNRLECKGCEQCVDLARSYLQSALKRPSHA